MFLNNHAKSSLNFKTSLNKVFLIQFSNNKVNLELRTFKKFSTQTDSISLENVQPFNKIPGPPRIPILGNLHLYKFGYYKIEDYHNVLHDYYEKYGPIVREDFGNETVIHVFDPSYVKTVYGATGKIPEVPPLQKATQVYRQQRSFSLGLGNLNGEEWYRLRSAVQQMMMRPKEVQNYLPFTDKVAQDFVLKIESCSEVDFEVKDLRTLAAKWNLESSGMICFENRLGCLDKNEKLAEKLIRANVDIFHLSACLKFSLGFYKYFTTPKWKKFQDAEDFFYETANKFFDEAILQVKKLIEANDKEFASKNKYNFLSYLLSRKDLSEKDVRIITFSLFADGLSTTTPALLFNLFTLAKNINVQEKLGGEIESNVPKNSEISSDVLNNMVYLKACVKETFRLYPGGTEVSRIIPNDLVLGNYLIPSGTHVDLNQSVLLSSEKYFPNAKEFQPERWLRGNEDNLNSHPFLLIPFGHGTRMCAGRRFAEQDLYIVLCRIIQKFRITLVNPQDEMERVYSTLLFPKNPLRLRFIPKL